MVRFIDNLFVTERLAPRIGKIKWKLASGIGMTGVYFITMSENTNDLFDIYSAGIFKQRALRKSNKIIVGVADGYLEAQSLAENMIRKCIEETGSTENMRKYFDDFVEKNL